MSGSLFDARRVPAGTSTISIRNLSLEFPIFHGGARSLKKMLFRQGKAALTSSRSLRTGGEVRTGRPDGGPVYVQALEDVSVEIRSGERVGLIGHNGAGKSTLLRVMAGIYMPDSLNVAIRGQVAALLDVNSGMNPELTGRENITLMGRHKGLNTTQIRQLEQDVESFAQLDTFLDLPVRLYSSGMIVRLGFGLATAITPQILLMDEWFMAGDFHFRERAEQRLSSVVNSTDILVITSHALDVLETWCTRLIWMEGGRIRMDGPTADVMAAYREEMQAPEPEAAPPAEPAG
ncbi:ABC transporter ATP-binding protein [Acetobacter farinalis]|uniref:ABC transporter ATP-binding protein n=1 Tax=Acetobacter farinalis TaxID=1260984 RepID=A0ABT3Q8M3_9PROT|nr:ABC transporter ATP-binding protein [Acetobacter farinalis]MCX2561614.1 ABC transporter ATP-binding protein [Acetobacter farinalis]NHO30158.1 ATP-binding cassette domain-containing protein [Acetobacter farinalis]